LSDETAVLRWVAAFAAPGFALGALLFFKLMRRSWLRAQRYIAVGGVTQGAVVKNGRVYSESAGTNSAWVCIVEYRDPSGESHTIVRRGVTTSTPTPIGTPVRIAFDPQFPDEAVIADFARKLYWVGWLCTFLFGAAALGCLVFFITTLSGPGQ
jgi:Protein of unknown function (DUF3592)